MTELKTLKDLEHYKWTQRGMDYPVGEHISWIRIETLRQEAIKWIKEMDISFQRFKNIKENINGIWYDNLPKEFLIEVFEPHEAIAHLVSVQFWIKHFFNITEDDLK